MPPGKRDSTKLLTEPRARMLFVLVDVVLAAMMDDAKEGVEVKRGKEGDYISPLAAFFVIYALTQCSAHLFTASFEVGVDQQSHLHKAMHHK